MSDFLKLLFVFALIAVVGIAASIDPGRVTIVWFNTQVETSAIVLVVGVALVSFFSMGFMRLILSITGVPGHLRHWREKRDWVKKERQLTAAARPTDSGTDKTPAPKRRG